MRVVLRVDLWRWNIWVTWGLRVRGSSIALRGRGRLVIIAKVVFLLISTERTKNRTKMRNIVLRNYKKNNNNGDIMKCQIKN